MDQLCNDHPWYLDWPKSIDGTPVARPRFLTAQHFERLTERRSLTQRKLFARRFRSSESDLLDRVDRELRR